VAATKAADVPTLRFHDLRHVGNTLASNTGANLRELMARMGHASPQAALIYQHSTAERDRVIADALGEMIVRSLANKGDDQADEDE
jgi:integrase